MLHRLPIVLTVLLVSRVREDHRLLALQERTLRLVKVRVQLAPPDITVRPVQVLPLRVPMAKRVLVPRLLVVTATTVLPVASAKGVLKPLVPPVPLLLPAKVFAVHVLPALTVSLEQV